MSITLVKPSPKLIKVAADWMRRIDSPEEARLAHPHRVYVMDLDDVASGRDLIAAKPGPLRHFHQNGAEILGSIDVAHRRSAHRVVQTATGAHHTVMAAEIARAISDPEFRRGRYALRVLSIPGAFVTAVWLHAKARNVLIPIAPVNSLLTASRKYSERELLDQLKDFARKRLSFDNSPRGVTSGADGR